MSIIGIGRFSKQKPKEEVIEEKEESSVDFDAIIKANADKKAKEAEERLKKNKQTLKNYKIDPKKK